MRNRDRQRSLGRGSGVYFLMPLSKCDMRTYSPQRRTKQERCRRTPQIPQRATSPVEHDEREQARGEQARDQAE